MICKLTTPRTVRCWSPVQICLFGGSRPEKFGNPCSTLCDVFAPHRAGVVQHREHELHLLGLVELDVASVCVRQLLHKGLVSGLGEPALLVQQRQDAWRVFLLGESKGSIVMKK